MQLEIWYGFGSKVRFDDMHRVCYVELSFAGQWQSGTVIGTADTSGNAKRYIVKRDRAARFPETFGIRDMLLRE